MQKFSRRRASRRVAAGAAVVITLGHFGLLLILGANGAKSPPAPPAVPARTEFAVRLARPNLVRSRTRRRRNEAPGSRPQPAPPNPPPVAPPQPPAAVQPPLARPDYGRWTVAPQAPPSPTIGPGTSLSACTPSTLPAMTGAARAACERRLSQLGPGTPAFPVTGDRRKAREMQAWADYRDQLLAYKSASEMNSHPCPPQNKPTHGVYLDMCALVNGALVVKVR